MYKAKEYVFKTAKPVWATNREKEMNLWLNFKANIAKTEDCKLILTGSSVYNIFINNQFISFGPARCANGFYRVDELDISTYLTQENNEILIRCAGYNINSFYCLDEPSFLCAEIISNNTTLFATGSKNDFDCFEYMGHEQKVNRYSYQRTFLEVYNHNDIDTKVETSICENKNFIYRNCYYETYPIENAEQLFAKGQFIMADHSNDYKQPNHVRFINEKYECGGTYKGYPLSDVTTDSALQARNIDILGHTNIKSKSLGTLINKNEYAIYKMKTIKSGKIVIDVETDDDSELIITFAEVLVDDDFVNYRRMGTSDVIIHRFGPGKYSLSTFEPYALQFLAIYSTKSSVKINNVSMVLFEGNGGTISLKHQDNALNKIVNAAQNTYKQNTFTIYMDCPGRERAGWLCDSFFTSRVERTLTHKSEIEHNFLENFMLPEKFKYLPDGMLPMCYPGEHYNGNFIPNWAMWYVIELYEYYQRTNDLDFVIQAKDRIYNLLNYFKKFENEDSLLEKLEAWIFIEWSECNKHVHDVNYPTNMLYSFMLKQAGKLYNDDELIIKANKIKDNINKQAKVGLFYCENAIRNNGKLELSNIITETCQYYAFFTGVATKEDNKELLNIMVNDFGPSRDIEKTYPDIFASNAFIGDYLRLEILFNLGEYDKVIADIKGYFEKMADLTGTLWENNTPVASCCHGFASHVLYWLNEMGYLNIK